MEAKFKNFIKQNKLLTGCQKLLLEVSGGPDSLAMLDLFYKFREKFDLEIAVAHLDHRFREESKAEADFVENFTKNRGLDFFRKQLDLPEIIKKTIYLLKQLPEKKGLIFLSEIMTNHKFDLLALAHHRDDQAETVLLNLFRGTGLKGLSGIRSKTKVKGIEIIHPLLPFSKKEILGYCKKNNLQPRFDSSNQENIYSRNVIRNKIFPIVENEINDKAREVIARSSNLLAAEDEFLQQLALKKYKEMVENEGEREIAIDFNKFKNTDRVLQRRIYRYIYKQLNNNLDDLYLDHILEIEKLIKDKKTGRGVDIAAGIRVEISYEKLIFLKKDHLQIQNNITEKIKINLGEKIKVDGKYILNSEIVNRKSFSFSDSPQQAAFDYDKLKLPLFLRNRKDGDKIRPLGMSGHKKVKDILIDEKVPKFERDQLLLVVDSKDSIVWLAPYKISDDYKITKETDKVLILKLKCN